MMSLPVWLPSPMFLLGGLCPGGSLSLGFCLGVLSPSLGRGGLTPPNQKSRQYGPYWNAFLLIKEIHETTHFVSCRDLNVTVITVITECEQEKKLKRIQNSSRFRLLQVRCEFRDLPRRKGMGWGGGGGDPAAETQSC